MKALVTGGGGFLGRALCSALHRRGDTVTTFARGDYPALAALGVRQHRGDLADPAAIADAVAGHDVVFHVAARVGAAGSWDAFHRANVVGTRNVVAACREHAVPRLVFTSTPSVVFGHGDLEGVDESAPYAERFDAHYPRSKAEAERLVLAASDDTLRTIALRPHIVWGPGDTSLLPRLLERAPRLRRIAGPPKKTDQTFIDDAVAAHLRAADALASPDAARVAGRAYFVSSGEPVEVWSFIDRLLAAAGRPPIRRTVSPGLALAAGWLFETVHGLTGSPGEPRLSRWIVRELSTSHWFDITAARRDLGYAPSVSVDEGLRRLQTWITDTAR